MAAATRGGNIIDVAFRADRGSEEYTSKPFGGTCDRLGVVQPMGKISVMCARCGSLNCDNCHTSWRQQQLRRLR